MLKDDASLNRTRASAAITAGKDTATTTTTTTTTSTTPATTTTTTTTTKPQQRNPTKKSVLSYFSSPAGQKFLDDLEKEARAKRNAKAGVEKQPSRTESTDGAVHHISLADGREPRGRQDLSGGSTASADSAGKAGAGIGRNKEHEVCPDSDYENRDHVRPASDRHVAPAVWGDGGYSQSPTSHHIRPAGAAQALSGAREAPGRGSVDGDVFEDSKKKKTNVVVNGNGNGNGIKHDVSIRSELSVRDQVKLKRSFDQLLRDITEDQSTSEMGLGRLEFGYPFKTARRTAPTASESTTVATTTPVAVQTPARVGPTFSENGIVPQILPANNRVVLIADAAQDPTDLDARELHTGSNVVWIIESDFQINVRTPKQALKAPETVGSSSKVKRINPLRDTVRLRWRVFHPEYTEKSEFTFETAAGSGSELKRKITATIAEHKTKRTRDDDVETHTFNEKPSMSTEPVVKEPSTGYPTSLLGASIGLIDEIMGSPTVHRVAIPEPPVVVKEAFGIPQPIVAPFIAPIIKSVNDKEPVVTRPIVEEPIVEEPSVEEEAVVVEEPTVEEPVIEQPIVEPITVEEPVVEEPIVEEEAVVVEEPIVEPIAVEGPIVEEPVVEQPTVEPVTVEEAVVVEEPLIEEPIVEQPIVEQPATVEEPIVIPAPVEDEVAEVEVEETPLVLDTASSPVTQLPSPLSRVASPIPLEFDAEEEAEIKEAIQVAMQDEILETETPEVVTETQAPVVELDLSTLPALPDSPILEAIDIETLPPLPESPVLEAVEAEDSEEMADIELSDAQDELTVEGDVPSTEMVRQPSPPSSQPGTPTMDHSEESLKIVPYMPLTPPETPLSFRSSRERTIEFNLPLPLIMQPAPPPATSILDSPIFFRGKDRQVEDSPSHYFVPAPPSPSSPSHSLHDSPLSTSRMRRIGETIKEEDEDVEEVEIPAKVEDYESDVEEIVRSPRGYPSPPSSPMQVIVDAPTKCKELTRVPSFTIIYTPSPPPSIRDVVMGEDEDGGVSIARGASPAFDLSTSKGKEREEIARTLPSPVLEQHEDKDIEYDSTCRAAWATADDIFLGQPEHYHYSYQYDNRRPPTPASSICSLQRRWSGVSRTSYQTGITTPPASRPGSALGSNKLIGWNDSDHALRRSDSYTGSIRRDQMRDQSRPRKPLLTATEGSSAETGRPALRWSMSMPLIREQWAVQTATILPANRRGFASAIPDENVEEYDVQIPGTIQLLPATRGVIVTPPRIERRRRMRPQYEMGPHRRKIRSLVVYSPDDQLEGIGQLFGEIREFEEVEDESRVTEIVEVEEVKPVVSEMPTLRRGESVKEKLPNMMRRLKSRASAPEVERPHMLRRLKSKASAVSIDGGAALPVDEKYSLPVPRIVVQKAESLNEQKPNLLRRLKSRASSSDILKIAASAAPVEGKISVPARATSPAPESVKEKKPNMLRRLGSRSESDRPNVLHRLSRASSSDILKSAASAAPVEEKISVPARATSPAPESVKEKKPNMLRRLGSRSESDRPNVLHRLSRASIHDIVAASPTSAEEKITVIPRATSPAPESLKEKRPSMLHRLKSRASSHEIVAPAPAAEQKAITPPPTEEKPDHTLDYADRPITPESDDDDKISIASSAENGHIVPEANNDVEVIPRVATPVLQAEPIKEKKPSVLRRLGSRASSMREGEKPNMLNRLSRHSMHDVVAASAAPVQEKISVIPRAVTPAPRAITPAPPRAVTPAPPRAVTPAPPRAVTPAPPRAVTPAPRAVAPTPRAVAPTPRAVTPAPRAVTPVSRAVAPAPRAVTPAPRAATPVSRAATPAPRVETPIPQADSIKLGKKPSLLHRFKSRNGTQEMLVATPPAEEKAFVVPRAATPVSQTSSVKDKKPNMLRRLGSRASNVKDKLKDKVSTSSTKKLDKGKGKVVV
ncbi:hypothetical protein BZA05DRAFT_415213 [Tricharina praecox]|uniref:uncharacterized protein n=1 Tax=Tricharina praecox TaxID=43433 RepID=UPI00221E4DC9|nr:uncharacterized protein BZA05DRAFT_415213 [Tricharina praecox]KAI5857827.1 hypothetical protein BZA05DRAFT_415213 [Tricharina praecox]